MRKVLFFTLLLTILILSFTACRNNRERPLDPLVQTTPFVPSEQEEVGEAESSEAEEVGETKSSEAEEAASVGSGEQEADAASEGLTVDALANAEYHLEWPAEGKAQLTDGIYEEQYAEDSASALFITLSEMKAFGDLNADGVEDAAVVLVSQPGGSGTFYDLATVIYQDGQAVHVGTQFLGDRIQLQGLSIEDGDIAVEMITHGPDEPFCCPTQQVTQRYQFQGDHLVDLLNPNSESEIAAAAEASEVEVPAPEATAEVSEAEGEAETSQAEAPAPEATAEVNEAETKADAMASVATTNMVPYLPAVPSETQDGTCWTNSLIVHQAYAWRCSLEDGKIYDPCLVVDDKQTIVCGADPITNEAGFQLNLTNTLPEANVVASGGNQPWLVQLADGTICSFATGATPNIDGKRVNYNCSDDSMILGDLQTGEVWSAEKVMVARGDQGFFIEESQMVSIASLWEAAEPGSVIAQPEAAPTVDAIAVNQQTEALTEDASPEAEAEAEAEAPADEASAPQAEAESLKLAMGLDPEEIYVNIQGLANSVKGQVSPAGGYEANASPTEYSWPAHLRLTFDGETLSEWPIGTQRQILIYPVNEYRAMAESYGLDKIIKQIDTLSALLSDSPPAITGELPLLPVQGDSQVLQAKLRPLTFQNGSGIRFITYYTQDAYPMSNGEIFYTYQGLTADGQYYITLFYPISASVLANSTQETDNFTDYLNETTEALNRLEAAGYTPNLDQLDAMVQSLIVGGN